MGKKRTLLLILLMLAGILVWSYPKVSSAINRRNGSYSISAWQEQVGSLENEERSAQWEMAQQYNRALLSGDTPEDYDSILNLGNGMMGYIRIPKIDVRLPIYHGVEEDTLAKGVGHLENSSFPVGGEGNHAVLTGHTGLPSAELFTHLTELAVGDRFYIHVLDDVLCYQVDRIKVVLPSEGEGLQPEQGKDYCTLVTCTPYGINSHRLLVRGNRVEEVEMPLPHTQAQEQGNGWKWALGGVLLLLSGFVVVLVKRYLDGRGDGSYN